MDDSSEPATLREKAYASFTRHLLARDLKPGQFVSQRELVAFTGLPLGAIREIVPRLEAEGLLTTIPQRGMLSYEQVSWGPLAAAALVVTLPVLVLTLFAQRQIVAGLTAGAVKGG